jgi:hypothetical protein
MILAGVSEKRIGRRRRRKLKQRRQKISLSFSARNKEKYAETEQKNTKTNGGKESFHNAFSPDD